MRRIWHEVLMPHGQILSGIMLLMCVCILTLIGGCEPACKKSPVSSVSSKSSVSTHDANSNLIHYPLTIHHVNDGGMRYGVYKYKNRDGIYVVNITKDSLEVIRLEKLIRGEWEEEW